MTLAVRSLSYSADTNLGIQLSNIPLSCCDDSQNIELSYKISDNGSRTHKETEHSGVLKGVRSAYRPSVDHEEGFGRAVEGAGRQGLWIARNDVAQVIVGMRGFAEGEFGNSCVAVIFVVQQVFQRVEEVS